jgi:hypothetical protein
MEHEQMAKLVLFPSQPPLVDVPSERKIHIFYSQPIRGMIMDDEHEVEFNLLHDVAQVS